MSGPRSPLERLYDAHQFIAMGITTGERQLLEEARVQLAEVLASVAPTKPRVIAGVPHLCWPPRGFTWNETASSYCSWNHRWVVSLIASSGPEKADTAARACAAAYDLVVGLGSEATRWYVHDRLDGRTFVIPQADFMPAYETPGDRRERGR